jgi:predicted TIM-barrel fold metal-dependent hydrolase
VKRRSFLRNSALFTGALCAKQVPALEPTAMPVIDTHIHLFDPTRTGGIPWPKPEDKALYKPALPDRYLQASQGFGIVGAIAIEASPLLSDNDWLLGIAEKNPIIVGIVGDLVPGSPEFTPTLERLRRNPLFLGIRYGNLWDRDLTEDIAKPGFLEGLRQLSGAGLVFESANPTPRLVQTLADISAQLPELTMVIDHLPHGALPAGDAERKLYLLNLEQLGKAPNVFIKLSEILAEKYGKVSEDLATYRDTLDRLWHFSGEDKVMYGSDWPNSDTLAPYDVTIRLLQQYLKTKSRHAQENFFWRNSLKAYRWKPRSPAQETLR